jgi:hypothetical protein
MAYPAPVKLIVACCWVAEELFVMQLTVPPDVPFVYVQTAVLLPVPQANRLAPQLTLNIDFAVAGLFDVPRRSW